MSKIISVRLSLLEMSALHISVSDAINQLQEMFPNHDPQTIRRILREKDNNVQNAINVLLKTKPDLGPKPLEDAQSQHIFPNDFLRWPKDVNYVKVFEDNYSNSLVEDDAQILPIDSKSVSSDLDGKNLALENFKSTNPSAWENFKKKFKQSRSYDQI